MLVNGNPHPTAIFGEWAMDLPVLVPIATGLCVGLIAGMINGALIASSKSAIHCDAWLVSVGTGLRPVYVFTALVVLFHLIMTYAKL